jgi:hypothetical protein
MPVWHNQPLQFCLFFQVLNKTVKIAIPGNNNRVLYGGSHGNQPHGW